jgi:hypothetical protein
MFTKVTFLFCFLLTFFTTTTYSQATLEISNQSGRNMLVKVMEFDGGDGSLYEQVSVAPYSSRIVQFYTSGTYFTKTKATLSGKEPVYEKGKAFQVVNNSRGHSVLKLTFSIKESSIPVTSGKRISKGEFDKN